MTPPGDFCTLTIGMSRIDQTTQMLPITPGHVSGLMEVQRAAFPPSAQESAEVLGSVWNLAPDFCRVAVGDSGNVCGYILAHPWIAGSLPPMQKVLGGIPAATDAVFIHDLAVAESHRGSGMGRALIDAVLHVAQSCGLARATLIAAPGSAGFWDRFGFSVDEALTETFRAEIRASYGFDGEFRFRSIAVAERVPVD